MSHPSTQAYQLSQDVRSIEHRLRDLRRKLEDVDTHERMSDVIPLFASIDREWNKLNRRIDFISLNGPRTRYIGEKYNGSTSE